MIRITRHVTHVTVTLTVDQQVWSNEGKFHEFFYRQTLINLDATNFSNGLTTN